MIVSFVYIGGKVDHHCLSFFLEVIARFVDSGGILDHHCLKFLFRGDCSFC